MMARAASGPPSARERGRGGGDPGEQLRRGRAGRRSARSSRPARRPAQTPSASPTASAVACVVWKPSAPVKQFAPPGVEHDRAHRAVGDDLLRPDDRVRLRAVAREHGGGVLQRAAVDDEGEVGVAAGLEARRRPRPPRSPAAMVTRHGATPFTERPSVSCEAERDVRRLDRRTGRALHQVVDRADHDHPTRRSSTASPMSAVFAPVVSPERGKTARRQHVHERLVGVGRPPTLRAPAAASTPGTSFAVDVARMPRAIGTSTGVNEMVGSVAPATRRFCRISGVCRWTPPTWYADAEPEISLASRSVRRRLAGARGADREHGDQVVGRDDARRDTRRQRRA